MTLNNLFGDIALTTEKIHKRFRKEVNISKHIPIEYFSTNEIFMTKNGEFGAIIKLVGVPFEVKDSDEINHLQYLLGFTLKSLDDGYSVYVTNHRKRQANKLDGVYPEGSFSQEFHEAYSDQFQNAKLYVNDIYITLIQKASQTKINKSVAFLERISIKKHLREYNENYQQKLNEFRTVLTNIVSTLSAYSPTLLSVKTDDQGIHASEVMSFLSILVNARSRDYSFPKQSISTSVPDRRLFFGNKSIHFEGLFTGDDQYGAILSIKKYSPFTKAGMLNGLLTTSFEYITTHTFVSIDKNQALKLINTQIKRLHSTGDAAKSQIDELEVALDDLASGKINYGFHHNTILVLSNDVKSLEEKVAKIIKIYQDQQIVVIRETLNIENAFWAQIPANFKYITRHAPISSNNFSCFCSLHNYYSGYINQNHLGSALMLVETPSKTPLYLNLHERASGNKNDLPRGHTTLIGPSNAGKTVMMTVIDTMYKKHDIRSIFFDRNLGCEINVLANNGCYYRLIPGEPTKWNPCQIADNINNRQFLRDLLTVLSTSISKVLTSNDHNQIAEVVERNFSLPFQKRNLSNIASFFRLDFTGLDTLSRYLRLPDRTGKSGDRAYLFDNDVDELNFNSNTIGFDMTHWLTDSGDTREELLPISMYLFHRMQESFDGRLTGIYLDEGWQILQNPYWRTKIQEYLMTLRKLNVFLFLATQSPDKLAESELSSALIQGAATIIYLANPKAEEKDYIDKFKLTPREFELIKNFDLKSRNFLIKQGNEAAVGRINLNGLEKYLSVLSGNVNSVRICEEIRQEYGDNPNHWLPLFYKRII